MSVGVPSDARYGSKTAPVKFSQTPSCMIFTDVAAKRPAAPRSRSVTSSSICSRPFRRSHHSAPTTRAVSSPFSPAVRYVDSESPDVPPGP